MVVGIVGYDHIHEEVLKLLGEGKFPNIEKLITRKIKLDDVVEDGLKRLISEKDRQGQSSVRSSHNTASNPSLQ